MMSRTSILIWLHDTSWQVPQTGIGVIIQGPAQGPGPTVRDRRHCIPESSGPELSVYALGRLCRAKTRTWLLKWYFVCQSDCSPVLVDQAADDLSSSDPCGSLDGLAGLVRRMS